jgi:hypothetical protein
MDKLNQFFTTGRLEKTVMLFAIFIASWIYLEIRTYN